MSHETLDLNVSASRPTEVQPSRSPTRRTLLALFAAAPILPTGAPSSTQFSRNDAKPLIRLFSQFEAITAVHERASARIDRREDRFVAEISHRWVRLASSPGQQAWYAADP